MKTAGSKKSVPPKAKKFVPPKDWLLRDAADVESWKCSPLMVQIMGIIALGNLVLLAALEEEIPNPYNSRQFDLSSNPEKGG